MALLLEKLSKQALVEIKKKLIELHQRVPFQRSSSFSKEDKIIIDESNKDDLITKSIYSTSLQYEEFPSASQKQIKEEKKLPKSIIFEPGFEKLHQIPTKISTRQRKKLKKLEKMKSKGKGWYDMKAPEMDEEKLNELKVIQMRGVLDPKRFYKKTDIRPGVLPKYFQTGTIVENKADFFSGRVPKKQRKKSLVDELFDDAEFKRYQKRKYSEIVSKKLKTFKKKKRK